MSPPNLESKSKTYRIFLCLVLLQLFFIAGFIYKTWTRNRERGNYSNGVPKFLENVSQQQQGQEETATRQVSLDLPSIDDDDSDNLPSLHACSIPKLNPYHKSVLPLLKKNRRDVLGSCERKYPLLFESRREESALLPVKKEEDFLKDGYNSCCYRTIERTKNVENPEAKKPEGLDPIIISPECFPISLKNKTEIPNGHEFIAIYCKYTHMFYRNRAEKMVDVHAFVPVKPRNGINLSEPSPVNKEGGKEKLNVVIFGLDSVSRMSFLRTMPQTYALLMKELGAVEMAGYNKIADATYGNLVPLLTSNKSEELKENWTKAGNVDDFPLIWKEYSKEGYFTSFSEDDTHGAILNYQLPGFNKTPTDYYLRPISVWANKHIWFYDVYASCYGPRLTLQYLLNYMEKFVHLMSQEKKNFFQLTWSTHLTHNFLDRSVLADVHIHKSLKWLNDSGYLNNTVVILMSDHGLRRGKSQPFRDTIQGRLEDQLPFAFFVLPESFKVKYQVAYQNLVGSRDKLFTTLDLHETLKDILHLERIQDTSLIQRQADLESLGRNLSRGISRFLPIPSFRTCEMAEIPEQFCSCTLLKSVRIHENPDVEKVAKVGVSRINFFLPTECIPLELENVTTAQYVGNEDGEKMESYLMNFQTKPGGGQFQALISRSLQNEGLWEVRGEIDRINSFNGTQHHCVKEEKIKPFCYCKDEDFTAN